MCEGGCTFESRRFSRVLNRPQVAADRGESAARLKHGLRRASAAQVGPRSGGCDDRLDAFPGCGVGEGLADLVEGEARGDEPRDPKAGEESERAVEGRAATEDATDPDLAILGIEEIERELYGI